MYIYAEQAHVVELAVVVNINLPVNLAQYTNAKNSLELDVEFLSF